MHQFIILILIVPLPLFFSHYVYDVGGLTGWVAVGIAWTFFSAISVVLYPLWESRHAIIMISSGIYKVRCTSNSIFACYLYFYAGSLYEKQRQIFRSSTRFGGMRIFHLLRLVSRHLPYFSTSHVYFATYLSYVDSSIWQAAFFFFVIRPRLLALRKAGGLIRR